MTSITRRKRTSAGGVSGPPAGCARALRSRDAAHTTARPTLGALVLAFLSAWLLAASACTCGTSKRSSSAGEDDSEATTGSAERSAPRRAVVVRGTVSLHVPPGLDDEGMPTAGASEFVPAQGVPDHVVVASRLEPAPAGECRLRVWQGGVLRAADPRACDAQGAYSMRVDEAEPGPVAVEIEVSGALRAVVVVEVPEDPGADRAEGAGEGTTSGEGPDDPAGTLVVEVPSVALGLAVEVRGTVVDARDRPLAGIEIQAMPTPDLGEPEPWRAYSDDQGVFVFDTLPPGPLSLRAHAPGHALTVVEAVAPESDILMRLTALIDLEGRVIASPEQCAASTLRIEGSALWPAVEHALAPDGSFVVRGLPDGVYGMEVIMATERGPELASVPLENITPDVRVDLGLFPAFRIPIVVRDDRGAPVAGARVFAGYASIGMLLRAVETDAAGQASLGPFVEGPYVVSVEAPGYLPAAPLSVEVHPPSDGGRDGAPPQTIVLLRPAALSGVVVDEAGQPVPGAFVDLEPIGELVYSLGESESRAQAFLRASSRPTTGMLASGSLGVTQGPVPDIPRAGEWIAAEEAAAQGLLANRDGAFSVEALVPGRFRLRARHGEHAASATTSVSLSPGQHLSGVRLVLRRGVPLTGRVLDDNGLPILGATVEVGDGLVWLDEHGVFEAGMHRGKVSLIARAPGHEARRITVDLPESRVRTGRGEDVAIELMRATGRLRLHVVDGNGQPVEGAEVDVQWADGLQVSQSDSVGRGGALEFEDIARGKVRVEITHPEFALSRIDVIVDTRGRDKELEVVLDRGFTVEVVVRDEAGVPLSGASVRAGDRAAFTETDGGATLDRLVGNKVLVEVAALGFAPRKLTVPRDGPGTVDIRLVEASAADGVIDDERGEPVAGAVITAACGTADPVATESDAKGRFSFPALVPGPCTFSAEAPPGLRDILAFESVTVTIPARTATHDLRLRFDRI